MPTNCQTNKPVHFIAALIGTPVRVALGGLLAFSGVMKLGLTTFGGTLRPVTPQDFYFSIKKFDLPIPDNTAAFLAFMVPWMELLTGLAILVGLWTRAAAWLSALFIAAFSAGIVSLMLRDIQVKCSCFGAIDPFCGAADHLGPCHLIRNAIFFAAAVVVALTRGGRFSIDGLFARSTTPATDPRRPDEGR
jgi:uncharacterized membrane protein YphA (DoxX/SURF4 family)